MCWIMCNIELVAIIVCTLTLYCALRIGAVRDRKRLEAKFNTMDRKWHHVEKHLTVMETIFVMLGYDMKKPETEHKEE